MNKFKDLNISEALLKSLDEQGIVEPTEIQAKTIPLVMEGKDVVAQSATGSGKTLAFSTGILNQCVKGQGLQSLIMCPTRELAEQVRVEIGKFSKFNPLNVMSIYGGVGIQPQIDNLPKADVVVGTPGRLLDHLQRGTIDLSKVKILVLDEADRMFEMGFIEDVEEIIKPCPKDRQTLLYSATITDDVFNISKKYMNNAERVTATVEVDPSKLIQVYYDVPNHLKFSLLVGLIKEEKSGLVMVFCNTQRYTDFVEKNLNKAKIEAIGIHGGMTQSKRTHIMKKFNNKNKVYVLVCTDVAARGLDIKGVSHVYNYDIPKDAKQYVHRIGRTARAGSEGKAINLVSSRDHENFDRVLRECDVTIPKEETPYIKKIEFGGMQQKKKPYRRYNL